MSVKVTVRIDSREHRGCDLEILEEELIVRVSCEERRRFGKPHVARFEEGVWNLRSRRGSEVSIGNIVLLFPSDEDACSLVRRALSISYARVLEKISGSVTSYFRRRSEILLLLRNLSRSPRSTLISMASQLVDCKTDPFDCAVEKIRREGSELYKKFLEDVGEALSKAPRDLVDRVLTIVKTIRELQLKILENRMDDVRRIIEHIERELGYSIDRARVEKIQASPGIEDLGGLFEEIVNMWINRIMSSINNRFLC